MEEPQQFCPLHPAPELLLSESTRVLTVAGSTVSENGTTVSPLLWQNGTLQTLPILMGYQQSAAIAVNDSGAAAGAAFDVNFHELADPLNQGHAVLFNTDGTVSDLGVLSGDHSSFSTGINNSGWVVGFSSSKSPDISLHLAAIFESPSSSDRAFLYANGKMYDLNTLVTNGTGWSLGYATAINNNGQIIGTGIVQGTSGAEQHGFLLTLVPTPGPAITGIAGVGGSVPYVANISDNGIVGIYGSNLAAATAGLNSSNVINNELPTNLGGTCVESGTTKWPLFFVSSGQVNALAAGLPASGAAPVSVVTNCGTANEVVSPVTNVPVAAVAPEFLYFIQTASGDDPVAAVDYTTGIDVGSSGLIPGATFAAVHEGDTDHRLWRRLGAHHFHRSDRDARVWRGRAHQQDFGHARRRGGGCVFPVVLCGTVAGIGRPLSNEFHGAGRRRERESAAGTDRGWRQDSAQGLHHRG